MCNETEAGTFIDQDAAKARTIELLQLAIGVVKNCDDLCPATLGIIGKSLAYVAMTHETKIVIDNGCIDESSLPWSMFTSGVLGDYDDNEVFNAMGIDSLEFYKLERSQLDIVEKRLTHFREKQLNS